MAAEKHLKRLFSAESVMQASGMSPDALRRRTPSFFREESKPRTWRCGQLIFGGSAERRAKIYLLAKKRKGVLRRRLGSLLHSALRSGRLRGALSAGAKKSLRRAAGGATCRVGALLKAANRARERQNTVGRHAFSFRLMRLAFVFISVHLGFRHCDIFTALVQ